jgi:CPA2 family monovalent cation:H+ antiporter-2
MEEAAHHFAGPGFQDLVILLISSVLIVAIFKRLNISSVLGYLVVGIIVGPYGFSMISDVDQAKYIAEFGVVFLLFAIGLELTFNRLIQMRRQVFGYGSLQVLISGTILGGITYLISNDFKIAFVAGFVFSLSSTAIILQVLSDRGEEMTQYGRLSISTLILQDLAFVPLLIMIPIIAKGESGLASAVFEALIQGTIALAIIVVLGKRLLRPLYAGIALLKSQELFIATTLAILLGTAWITELNGLSLALGAFVAGLLIAETEYRAQVQTDLKPFKGLLMGLFFIAVGMKIDLSLLTENIKIILALTASIIFIKSIIVYALARIFGFSRNCSIKAGLMLSQVSEFGFVLFALAAGHQIISHELSQIFIITISMSMVLTPLLAIFGDQLARRLDLRNPVHYETTDIEKEVSDLTGHIVVVGFDKIGRTTCELLKYKDVKYVILDGDPQNVHRGRKDGYPIYFGQCNMVENLEKLGLERAKMVVITSAITEEVNELSKNIRDKFPDMHIIARAKDRDHAAQLKEIGVNISIAEMFESSLMIGNFILTSVGVSDSDVEDAIDSFRKKEHPDSQIKGVLYKAKDEIVPI